MKILDHFLWIFMRIFFVNPRECSMDIWECSWNPRNFHRKRHTMLLKYLVEFPLEMFTNITWNSKKSLGSSIFMETSNDFPTTIFLFTFHCFVGVSVIFLWKFIIMFFGHFKDTIFEYPKNFPLKFQKEIYLDSSLKYLDSSEELRKFSRFLEVILYNFKETNPSVQ